MFYDIHASILTKYRHHHSYHMWINFSFLLIPIFRTRRATIRVPRDSNNLHVLPVNASLQHGSLALTSSDTPKSITVGDHALGLDGIQFTGWSIFYPVCFNRQPADIETESMCIVDTLFLSIVFDAVANSKARMLCFNIRGTLYRVTFLTLLHLMATIKYRRRRWGIEGDQKDRLSAKDGLECTAFCSRMWKWNQYHLLVS